MATTTTTSASAAAAVATTTTTDTNASRAGKHEVRWGILGKYFFFGPPSLF